MLKFITRKYTAAVFIQTLHFVFHELNPKPTGHVGQKVCLRIIFGFSCDPYLIFLPF